MHDINDIQVLLNTLVKDSGKFKDAKVYKKGEKNFIRVRDTFSDKYEKYLDLARPRQSKGQKQYRKDFFEQEGNPTTVFVDRVCNKFSVIFQNKDFSINYENEKSKELIESTNFEKWFTTNVFRMFCLSPNGAIYLKNSTDGKTEGVSFGFAEPCDVMFLNDDLGIVKDGQNYFVFTKENNYHFVRERGKDNSVPKVEDYDIVPYQNFSKKINCYKIGLYTKEVDLNGQELKVGIIDNAITHLRMAQFHWLDYATNCAYGVNNLLWITSNKSCGKCNGKGYNIEGQAKSTCSTCNGKGADLEMYNGGADEVMVIPMQVAGELNGSDNNKNVNIPTNVGGYIKGDPEPAKVYSQFFEDEFERAFFAISMETILRETTQGSGRQKELEGQELEHMLKVLSGVVCDLLQMILIDIHLQMNGLNSDVKAPNVVYPSEFKFQTEAELLKSITDLADADVSELYLMALKLKLVETQSGYDSVDVKRQRLMNIVDPLAGKNSASKALAVPTLEWWQNVLSNQILHLIFKAELEHADFWEANKKVIWQMEVLVNYAKAIAELTKPKPVIEKTKDENLEEK